MSGHRRRLKHLIPPWYWQVLPLLLYVLSTGIFVLLFSYLEALLWVSAAVLGFGLLGAAIRRPHANRASPFLFKKFAIFCGLFGFAQALTISMVFAFSAMGPLEPKLYDYHYSEQVILSLVMVYGLSITVWGCVLSSTDTATPHEAATRLFPARFGAWIGGYVDAVVVWHSWLGVIALFSALILLATSILQLYYHWPHAYVLPGATLGCLTGYIFRYSNRGCQQQLRVVLAHRRPWQGWLVLRLLELGVVWSLAGFLGAWLAQNGITSHLFLLSFFEASWVLAWPWLLWALALLSVPWLGQQLAQLSGTVQLSMGYGLLASGLYLVVWSSWIPGAFLSSLSPPMAILNSLILVLSGSIGLLRGVFQPGQLLSEAPLWVKRSSPIGYAFGLIGGCVALLGIHVLLGWWGLVCLLAPIALLMGWLVFCAVLSLQKTGS